MRFFVRATLFYALIYQALSAKLIITDPNASESDENVRRLRQAEEDVNYQADEISKLAKGTSMYSKNHARGTLVKALGLDYDPETIADGAARLRDGVIFVNHVNRVQPPDDKKKKGYWGKCTSRNPPTIHFTDTFHKIKDRKYRASILMHESAHALLGAYDHWTKDTIPQPIPHDHPDAKNGNTYQGYIRGDYNTIKKKSSHLMHLNADTWSVLGQYATKNYRKALAEGPNLIDSDGISASWSKSTDSPKTDGEGNVINPRIPYPPGRKPGHSDQSSHPRHGGPQSSRDHGTEAHHQSKRWPDPSSFKYHPQSRGSKGHTRDPSPLPRSHHAGPSSQHQSSSKISTFPHTGQPQSHQAHHSQYTSSQQHHRYEGSSDPAFAAWETSQSKYALPRAPGGSGVSNPLQQPVFGQSAAQSYYPQIAQSLGKYPAYPNPNPPPPRHRQRSQSVSQYTYEHSKSGGYTFPSSSNQHLGPSSKAGGHHSTTRGRSRSRSPSPAHSERNAWTGPVAYNSKLEKKGKKFGAHHAELHHASHEHAESSAHGRASPEHNSGPWTGQIAYAEPKKGKQKEKKGFFSVFRKNKGDKGDKGKGRERPPSPSGHSSSRRV